MMIKNIRNSARLLRIGLILARHDALFGLEALSAPPAVIWLSRLAARRKLHARPGKRLAAAFEELGPTFIKFGQLLSTRPDLVGEAVAHDLADLRDHLPPFSAKIAKEIIEAEFEKPISELFQSFGDKAIAAASIAQVHFAVTPDGREVAVKVLRPGVREQFRRDVELFYWLAQIAQDRMPHWQRFKPMETVKTMAELVRMELDLRFEAAAASELRDNMLADKGFYVPYVYWETSGGTVLTTERIIGIPLGDVEALRAANIDLRLLVEYSARAFFNQVFRDGFFHADMHPGNLFVLPDSTLAVVDFGIMGRIDRQSQLYLAEILWGFLKEDYYYVSKVHFDAGYVPKTQSVDNFALACRAIAEPILNRPLNEISIGRLLGLLFEIAETFQMETQPQLLMLQKTMVLAEGVGRSLYPDINMWKMAEPLIAEWGRANLSPTARLKHSAQEGLSALERLPAMLKKVEHIIDNLESGGIKLHPDTVANFRQSGRGQRQWLRLGWFALFLILLLLAAEMSHISF